MGHKTLSVRGQTNYRELIGTIPATETECPNVDTWEYPGETVVGVLPQGAHATLTMKGHVYAYELTPKLKDVLRTWKRNRSYRFGTTTWTAGAFRSDKYFLYKGSKDANLLGEEETSTVINIDFRPRTGNVIKVSHSKSL